MSARGGAARECGAGFYTEEMSDAEAPRADTSASDFPLPPATFEYFLITLKMQAEMHLGLLRLSEDEPVQPNLRAARHTIDLLAMLQDKTRGNLSTEEQRLLENSLTELRFRYVYAVEEDRKKNEQERANPAASTD